MFGAIFKPRPYPAFVLLATINRAGILTAARVTKIERKSGMYKGKKEEVRYHSDFPEEHRWLE